MQDLWLMHIVSDDDDQEDIVEVTNGKPTIVQVRNHLLWYFGDDEAPLDEGTTMSGTEYVFEHGKWHQLT